MTHEEEADLGDRQFVTALARGLDLLGAFRIGDCFLSNQELARRTGLAKPTVSRLSYTLTKTGHLVRDEVSGEYRISAKALGLGFRVLAATDIRERFATEVAPIVRGPNGYVTVALAERAGTRAVYLATSRQRGSVGISIEVGARLPLFYSAIGRALLVGMREEERAAVLEDACTEFPAARIKMEEGLHAALRDYAKYGFCTSFGAWKPEITAIAAPVVAPESGILYAINVGAPSFATSPDELCKEYAPLIKTAASALSGLA